ncbi:exodeoxyribonuclease VII large subunit [compost metagenome]
MTQIESHPKPAGEALTPEILATTLKIQHPHEVILVKGVAERVKPWPSEGEVKRVYGELCLDGASLGFSASPQFAPREGEAVVMKGTLRVQQSKAASRNVWRGQYEVQLTGAVVGGWTPRQGDVPVVRISERPDRAPLETFVEGFGAQALTILASAHAETDLARSFTAAGLSGRPTVIRAPFNDEAELLKAARQAVAGGAEALALARGGGAGLELIADSPSVTQALIDLKVPFYSAMGHGADIFLMDKYADQSFHTPSELGAAVGRAVEAVAERGRVLARLSRELDRNSRLEQALVSARNSESEARLAASTLTTNLGRRVYAHQTGVSVSWKILCVGALAVVLALVAVFFLI